MANNRPDWGAGFLALGQSLGQLNEQKRLEEERKLLRQQQLDDEQRKRDQAIADAYFLHGQPISQGYIGQDATGVVPGDPVAALSPAPLPDYTAQSNSSSIQLSSPMDNVSGIPRIVAQRVRNTIPVPAAALGLNLPEPFTGPAVRNVTPELDPNVVLGGKSVPYAPWMQGMAPDAASEIYTRMNPVPKQTTRTVPVRLERGGQTTTLRADETNLGGAVAPFETSNEVPQFVGNDPDGVPRFKMVPVIDRSHSGEKKPKDPKEIALEMYGGWKNSGDYDPKTQTATPYRYPVPGSMWNPATAPIDISAELAVAAQQAADAGYKIDTVPDATRVLEFVLGQYDMEKANQMSQDFAQGTEGWVPETRKVGGKVVEIPGKFKLPKRGAKDPKMDAIAFYADVINKQLADGADEVEWNTIKAWLKKNDLTFEEVRPYIKLAQALTPAPEGF